MPLYGGFMRLIEISWHGTLRVWVHHLPGRGSSPLLLEQAPFSEAINLIKRYRCYGIEPEFAAAQLVMKRSIFRTLNENETQQYAGAYTF